jgi:hypothetical protein
MGIKRSIAIILGAMLLAPGMALAANQLWKLWYVDAN